jgi:hypothetical protein
MGSIRIDRSDLPIRSSRPDGRWSSTEKPNWTLTFLDGCLAPMVNEAVSRFRPYGLGAPEN